MADYIVVPGKIEIYVACNFAWVLGVAPNTTNITARNLMKLGESADELRIELEEQRYPVPGDRNGGRNGDPIEEQFMGMSASCNLELSTFDPQVANALLTSGGLITTPGTIPQSAIGAFTLRDRSYRFLFKATTDVTRSVNFPATVVNRGHVLGGGTKFEMFRCSLAMRRTPPGHWYLPEPSGSPPVAPNPILFDRVTTNPA
ncbi:MAG: hypothetical protein KF752_11735 [Pirellulaceae bacterium]|nr:hypothetical protein [Pirellulaceae bacterium]